MHDYNSGLDPETFRVTADFALDGVAAGQNLAGKFRPGKSPGVWELQRAAPLQKLDCSELTVSVKDKAGNITELTRSFSVE